MKYANVLDLNVVGRMASGVVQVRLRCIKEDAPDVEVEMILMLSAEQAATVAEDLTTLDKLPPAGRLNA